MGASVASKVLQWSARHAAGSGLGSAAASKASSKAGSVFESVTGIRSVPPRNGEGGGLVDQTLGTLEDYRHPDSLEVVLLSGGKAMHVPASERPKVMHMHEVFRPDLMGRWLSCHMQEKYVELIQAAYESAQEVPLGQPVDEPVVMGIPVECD